MMDGIFKEIKLREDTIGFEQMKLWFWPIVFAFTVIFGVIGGIKGAFIGFLYGVVAGLFLIHESLKVDTRGRRQKTPPPTKKREIFYCRKTFFGKVQKK